MLIKLPRSGNGQGITQDEYPLRLFAFEEGLEVLAPVEDVQDTSSSPPLARRGRDPVPSPEASPPVDPLSTDSPDWR
jgi:hypothetical protein